MKAVTHLTFAGLVGVTAVGFDCSIGVVEGSGLALGSLLPDVDHRHSGIGKHLHFVSAKIERRFGHRTITHSLLGLLMFGLLFLPIYTFLPGFWWAVMAGILSHIVIDTCNINGVPFLWPNRLEFVMFYNRGWRVAYGSAREMTLLAVIGITALLLVPLAMDGFGPWFHRMVGTPNAAVQDYLRWRDKYEVFVQLKGENLALRNGHKERFRVIDALDMERLVVEDATRRAYRVGLMGEVDVHSLRVKVWKGEPIQARLFRVDMSGRILNDLLELLPSDALRVYVNAKLEITGHFDRKPLLGEFEKAAISGRNLVLRSARIEDIRPYAHLAIEDGSALIRAEYSAGFDLEAGSGIAEPSGKPKVRSQVLAIKALPSIEGVVVKIGDTVRKGDLVARFINDRGIADLDFERAEQEAIINEKEAAIEALQAEHTLQREMYIGKSGDLAERIETLHFLVERKAEPRAKLAQAENALRLLDEEALLAQTRYTSRLRELNEIVRQARTSLRRNERERGGLVEDQWVRSPIDGLVADIRFAGISAEGIDLEVVILATEAENVIETVAEKE